MIIKAITEALGQVEIAKKERWGTKKDILVEPKLKNFHGRVRKLMEAGFRAEGWTEDSGVWTDLKTYFPHPPCRPPAAFYLKDKGRLYTENDKRYVWETFDNCESRRMQNFNLDLS